MHACICAAYMHVYVIVWLAEPSLITKARGQSETVNLFTPFTCHKVEGVKCNLADCLLTESNSLVQMQQQLCNVFLLIVSGPVSSDSYTFPCMILNTAGTVTLLLIVTEDLSLYLYS